MTSAGAGIIEMWEQPVLVCSFITACHYFCQVNSIRTGIASYRYLALMALFPDPVYGQGTDPGGRKQHRDQEQEDVRLIPGFGA